MTDHAEAVRVVYDPSVVRYDELLRIFFSVVADPTLKNRQGLAIPNGLTGCR